MKIPIWAGLMILLTACSQPATPVTPLTNEPKLAQEASAFIKQHVDKYIKKCGEDYFLIWGDYERDPRMLVVQGKGLVVQPEGGYIGAQALTPAEILNKVTPIPESYDGRVFIKFSVARIQTFPLRSGVSYWQDNFKFDYRLTFKNGAWITSRYFHPVDCDVVNAIF